MIQLLTQDQYYQFQSKYETKPNVMALSYDDFDELINVIPANKRISLKKFFISSPGFRGLGNGVIQDIFHDAKLHPKCQVPVLTPENRQRLFESTRSILQQMIDLGGRSTETTLLGQNGEYQVKMSTKTKNKPCPNCNTKIIKGSFLGGSIYFCPSCQVEP